MLWSWAYGWADPKAGVPAARETIYRTGSISKSVTGVLMAILADADTVTLGTALAQLVPEIAEFREHPEGADPSWELLAGFSVDWAVSDSGSIRLSHPRFSGEFGGHLAPFVADKRLVAGLVGRFRPVLANKTSIQ